MNSYNIPFKNEVELCKVLIIKEDQLQSSSGKQHLPGQPAIGLNHRDVLMFLEKDLLTPLLDRMSPWLWLVATPKSTHVSPLHVQIVRGRNIVIAEDPELHLVWRNNRVFIKPLPTYLLSYAFWSHYLLPDRWVSPEDNQRRLQLLQASLGYIRTYSHLIQHESDLRIAKKEYLVPENLDLETWVAFSREFKCIQDSQVSGRYSYGDLRLSRLNFWAKPILRRSCFRKTAWEYVDHLACYITPLLFVFTTLSVTLSSLQVGVQSRPDWVTFSAVGAWLSVATLVGIVAVIVFLICIVTLLAGRETIYAFRKQIRKSWQSRKRKELVRRPDLTKPVLIENC